MWRQRKEPWQVKFEVEISRGSSKRVVGRCKWMDRNELERGVERARGPCGLDKADQSWEQSMAFDIQENRINEKNSAWLTTPTASLVWPLIMPFFGDWFTSPPPLGIQLVRSLSTAAHTCCAGCSLSVQHLADLHFTAKFKFASPPSTTRLVLHGCANKTNFALFFISFFLIIVIHLHLYTSAPPLGRLINIGMSITRNKQSNLSTLGLTVLTWQLCHQLAISPTHHSADLQNVIVMQSKRTQRLKFCIKQLSMRLRIMTMILASNQMAFNIKIKMIFCVNQNMLHLQRWHTYPRHILEIFTPSRVHLLEAFLSNNKSLSSDLHICLISYQSTNNKTLEILHEQITVQLRTRLCIATTLDSYKLSACILKIHIPFGVQICWK